MISPDSRPTRPRRCATTLWVAAVPDHLSAKGRLLAAIAIAGLLSLGWAVVYATGGTHNPWPHVMYAPIVLGAWAFGVPGALATAAAAGLVMGPLMPLDTVQNTPQLTANWLYRSVFFMAIGLLAGLSNRALLHRAEALAASEAKYRSIIRNVADLSLVVLPDATIEYASPAAERMLGRAPEQLVGASLSTFTHPGDSRDLDDALAPGGPQIVTLRVRHADGSWRHVEAVVTNLQGDPAVGGVVLNLRDMTERMAMESQLLHQALHDSLTGLANRKLFTQRIAEVLDVRDSQVAVVMVDLDRFKSIEESFGPEVADRIIQVIASRLQSVLRPGDVLARPDGCDFAMLCRGVSDPADAEQISQRLLMALREPLFVEDDELFVTASVGAAIVEDPDQGPEQALRDAYAATRHAKAAGGNRCALFTPGTRSAAARQLKTESALYRALERDELVLHYQPILELSTGRLTSMEALIRWRHPKLGLVPPSDFIPIAEETGMIVPIGAWVIDQACRQLARWQAEHGGPERVAVNLSARQLSDPDLVPAVTVALGRTGIAASSLVLEVTETALITHAEEALAALKSLRSLGVRLAIDDFGTGYSSLGYLRDLPVEIIKIDRSFVRDLAGGSDKEPIVSAIIGLAHNLGLDTIAEGVETEEQADKLFEMGCHRVQGYLYSRPQRPDDLRSLIEAGGMPGAAERRVAVVDNGQPRSAQAVTRR